MNYGVRHGKYSSRKFSTTSRTCTHKGKRATKRIFGKIRSQLGLQLRHITRQLRLHPKVRKLFRSFWSWIEVESVEKLHFMHTGYIGENIKYGIF